VSVFLKLVYKLAFLKERELMVNVYERGNGMKKVGNHWYCVKVFQLLLCILTH